MKNYRLENYRLKSYILLFALLILLPLISFSQDKKTDNKSDNQIVAKIVDQIEAKPVKPNIIDIESNCNNLHENISSCTEFRCITPDVENEGEVIMHYVAGFSEVDAAIGKVCIHQQSWDKSHDILTCKYSEASRKFVSNIMQKQQQGYKTTDEEAMLMEQIFRDECSVSQFNFVNEAKIIPQQK
jgi:hypothetical protein